MAGASEVDSSDGKPKAPVHAPSKPQNAEGKLLLKWFPEFGNAKYKVSKGVLFQTSELCSRSCSKIMLAS